MNPDDQTSQRERQEALSALMDGEASAAELACRAWRDDPGLRSDWYAYHLIGELMRSDEVHCAPQRDARFLGQLRQRLAVEPLVMAPAATAQQRFGRRSWVAPAAVAAGFVAVAGVLVALRVAAPAGQTAEQLAQGTGQGAASGVLAAAAAASLPGAEGRLIRSAELDRYLAAHRQYGNTSALVVPGGMVRNAAAAAPER